MVAYTRALTGSVLLSSSTLAAATRNDPSFTLGASTRAAIALIRGGQACALLDERDFVLPEDVQHMFLPVLGHRMVLSPEAKMKGIDVIVTDHHQVQDKLPAADVVIDPWQEACQYPFNNICGAEVVYKLIRELSLAEGKPLGSTDFLEFVALGTVCDIMPLIQEAMANSPKIGIINSYWLVIAMLAYILYYALIGCKNVNKDIPVE